MLCVVHRAEDVQAPGTTRTRKEPKNLSEQLHETLLTAVSAWALIYGLCGIKPSNQITTPHPPVTELKYYNVARGSALLTRVPPPTPKRNVAWQSGCVSRCEGVGEQAAVRHQSAVPLPCCRLTAAAQTACQTLVPAASSTSCPVAAVAKHAAPLLDLL